MNDENHGDVSAEEPDWAREACALLEWNPSRKLLGTVRRYQRSRARRGLRGLIGRKLAVLEHRLWSVVTGADIPLNCDDLGGGLLIPHPNGIVVHPDARLGPNCLLFQQVTVGQGGKKPGCPTLAGHVDVGAGAKILGGIHIGAHAKIGANAVVIDDVPAGTTVVGVPARPVRRQ